MRVRLKTAIPLVAFGASLVVLFVASIGAAGSPPGLQLLWVSVFVISGVWSFIVALRAIRNTYLRVYHRDRPMFAAGRCHACGYDTSTLVRGIVACPECGAVLASIPAESVRTADPG